MSLLKELFSLSEVKNHMDETEYTTWDSWRKACRKAYSEVTFEGDKDIAQAMYKEGRAVGEWDGSVGVVYKKPAGLKESAELAKKLVSGEKGGKSILAKIDNWFGNLIIGKDRTGYLPSKAAVKSLQSYGFSDDQIHTIREMAVEASETAVKTMMKRHPKSVPSEYVGKIDSNFDIHGLFLNVGDDALQEYDKLRKALFSAKLDKLGSKLNIVKEAVGTEAWQHGYDDAKNAKTNSSKPSRAKLYMNNPALMKKYEEGSREYDTAMKRKARNEKNPIVHEAEKLTSVDAERDGHTWMVSFTHCPGKTDKRDYTIRSVKAISSSQAVASAKAKLPADVRDCAEVDEVKMTDKKVDEGYGAFDGGKNALKRAEMKHELGHEDREAGNRTFSYSKPRAELGSFCIEIDGRCFKREGEPVKFSSKGNAEKAAATIASKDFNKGKTVKVVPLKEGLYGVAKGQVYVPADGSKDELTVLSVEPQLELATVRSKASGKESKIDCWKLAKVRYSLKENAAMQAIGKGLKPTAATKAASVADEVDAEVKTDVNTSPVEQSADDVETPTAEFKVGDKVMPTAGPHKGQTHSIIHVFPDGRVNLTPDGLKPDQIKYRLGVVTARADQVTLAESRIIKGSLLAQFSLMEAGARKDGFMPIGYGPKKGHKIEAYGRKGMKNTMWRKMFKSSAECEKWCQDNDATVEGSRELDDNEKA